MTLAIERAIERPTVKEKERAARWAAAWGLLCGIQTLGVNLKACDIPSLERRLEQGADLTIGFASSPLCGLDSTLLPQALPDTSLASVAAHTAVERLAPPSP